MFEVRAIYIGCTYLPVDPVDLPILILQLRAHVQGHIPQIANHCVNLAHVLLHLVLAGIVRDPDGRKQSACVWTGAFEYRESFSHKSQSHPSHLISFPTCRCSPPVDQCRSVHPSLASADCLLLCRRRYPSRCRRLPWMRRSCEWANTPRAVN